SLVAGAGRVGDDGPDGGSVQPGGDVVPVGADGAAAVEGDEDVPAFGAGGDEEVGGVGVRLIRRVRRAVGQRRGVGVVQRVGASDFVPDGAGVDRGEDSTGLVVLISGVGADDDLVLVDRIDGEVGAGERIPLRVGRVAWLGILQQSERARDAGADG